MKADVSSQAKQILRLRLTKKNGGMGTVSQLSKSGNPFLWELFDSDRGLTAVMIIPLVPDIPGERIIHESLFTLSPEVFRNFIRRSGTKIGVS
jgi:hypothetical protein